MDMAERDPINLYRSSGEQSYCFIAGDELTAGRHRAEEVARICAT